MRQTKEVIDSGIADVYRRLGEITRTTRTKMNLNQQQLALITGLHRTYISDIERGERNISVETLERLSCGLNMGLCGVAAFGPRKLVYDSA